MRTFGVRDTSMNQCLKAGEWHGGLVYREEEYPNLVFAKDGEIYDIAGKKTIVIGGAYSVDKWYRRQQAGNGGKQKMKDLTVRKTGREI